jgi:hypothetical protein
MQEGIAQLAELYPNCFRQPRQPLKIVIHNDIIARQPELQPGLIASCIENVHALRRLFGDAQSRRGADRPGRQSRRRARLVAAK